MGSQAESISADLSGSEVTEIPEVTAQETVPGRMVFTEAGNTDGWIATGLAIDPATHR